MCTVLEAPAAITPFFTVMEGVHEVFSTVIPESWGTLPKVFGGWSALADWARENRRSLEEAIKGQGFKPDREIKIKTKSGNVIWRHPMSGHDRTLHPVYALFCGTHASSDYKRAYALIRLQLLIARWEEMRIVSEHDSDDLIMEFYLRRYEDGQDYEVRKPIAMNRALELGDIGYVGLLKSLHPELPPEEFRQKLAEIKKDSFDSEQFTKLFKEIRAYFSLPSTKHTVRKRTAGWTRTSSFSRSTRNYTPVRVGTDLTADDPDDPNLRAGDQEIIVRILHLPDKCLSHGINPEEQTASPSGLLQGSESGSGTPPGQLGLARSRSSMIEIDKKQFVWSAAHLRNRENSLLDELEKTALKSNFSTVAERDNLEMCALAAVILETGRSLEDAICLRWKTAPSEEFSFIPGESGGESLWSWKTIEPEYKQDYEPPAGMEVEKAQHLAYRVHPVTDGLLRALGTSLPSSPTSIFVEAADGYRCRMNQWLKSFDIFGRLTIAKLSKVKWVLMSQINGFDSAECSLVFGRPEPDANVQLYYSLLPIPSAQDLFERATEALWSNRRSILWSSHE
jgi:hypothetical protein